MGYLVTILQVILACIFSTYGDYTPASIVMSSACLCFVLTKYLDK